MSNDTDTRVVAAKYTAVNTTTFTTSGVVCDWNTKVQDTHGAVTTGASWKFTAPVSGTYHVEVVAMRGGAIGIIFNLRKNGSSIQRIWQLLSVDNNASKSGSTTIELNAGDYIDLFGYAESSTTTLINDATLNSVSIFRLSGPSVIAASETVAVKVNASGGTTIAASSADTKVAYNTIVKDTHGAFSTVNNRFTAPVSGWYSVKASVRFDTASWTANNRHEMLLYKNGGNSQYLKSDMMPTTSSYYPGSLTGTTEIYLIAGDYLEIFVRQAEGTTRNLITDSTVNFASFVRIGN